MSDVEGGAPREARVADGARPAGRRRYGRWLALAVAALAIAYVGHGAAANYSGTCVPEQRRVSTREKILAVVEHVAVGDMVVSYPPLSHPEGGSKQVLHRRPATAEAFLRLHPNCCRIVTGGDHPRPALLDRLTGQFGDYVEIKHVRLIATEDGRGVSPELRTETYAVTTCGDVYED